MKKITFIAASLVAMSAWNQLQAAVVTEGFDLTENLVAGSQSFANIAGAETPDVFALISLKDMKTYAFDDVYGKQEDNVDMKFYIMGGASNATIRLYSMDGASATATKNSEYKGSAEGITIDNFTAKNATRFLKLSGVDFDAATAEQVGAIDLSKAKDNVNPIEANDVIAFKTASTSTVGTRVGLIKIESINRESESSSKGTITISIKMIKSGEVTTEGLEYRKEVKLGTQQFANGTEAGYEDIYSFFSFKEMKTYTMEQAKADFNNVDMKFYMLSGALRIYGMDNDDSKNAEYKDEFGKSLKDLLTSETTNSSRYLKLPAAFDFDKATADDIKAIDETTITEKFVKPAVLGDVIAFKASPLSTAKGLVGVFKITDITIPQANNTGKAVVTISVKRLIEDAPNNIGNANNEIIWKLKGKSIETTGAKGIFNLYSTTGQLIYSISVQENETINLSQYSGLYIVKFAGKCGKINL